MRLIFKFLTPCSGPFSHNGGPISNGGGCSGTAEGPSCSCDCCQGHCFYFWFCLNKGRSLSASFANFKVWITYLFSFKELAFSSSWLIPSLSPLSILIAVSIDAWMTLNQYPFLLSLLPRQYFRRCLMLYLTFLLLESSEYACVLLSFKSSAQVLYYKTFQAFTPLLSLTSFSEGPHSFISQPNELGFLGPDTIFFITLKAMDPGRVESKNKAD